MEEAKVKFITNIANLFKVKTIITLTVISAATYGFIKGLVPGELYATYVASIITYYFTKEKDK